MYRELKIFLSALCIFGKLSAQNYQVYRNETAGGLCSKSIALFADGSYNWESGCEQSSHFSFGYWTQKGDTVFFKEANRKKIRIVKSYSSKKEPGTKLLVKIFDNRGRNLADKVSLEHYVIGKGTYTLSKDSSGSAFVDFKRDNGVIIIQSLQQLFKQQIQIPTDSSNYFEITLNVSADWLFRENSVWVNSGNFALLKTKEGLTSLKADQIDKSGNIVKSILRAQN